MTEGTVLKWLMDSGASKHMCKDRHMFTTLVPHCAMVEFGNGYPVRVYWKGTVTIKAIGGALELTEVLLVPSLASNLFYVSQACKLGARCTFLEDGLGAYIEHAGKLVCTATYVNELYWVPIKHSVVYIIWYSSARYLSNVQRRSTRKRNLTFSQNRIVH